MTPDCPLINVNALSGLMNLTNIAWFFAIAVGSICGIVVLWRLFGVLKEVPALLWEILFYGISIALIAAPYWPEAQSADWMPIAGCIFLAGSILFTGHVHKVESNDTAFFGTLLVIYGGLALFYNSVPIGFLAIMALLSLVGFSVVSGGLCIAMGYEDEKKLPGGTLVAILLAAGATASHFFNVSFGPLDVFQPGAVWVASIVAGIGLLIISSKWYGYGIDDKAPPYALMQVVTLGLYGVGIFFGAVSGLDPLMYISAVFLAIYLIEKPHEIDDMGVLGHAFAGLVSAIIIGAAAYYVQNNMAEVNAYIEGFRQ